jgi:hypothetical protein
LISEQYFVGGALVAPSFNSGRSHVARQACNERDLGKPLLCNAIVLLRRAFGFALLEHIKLNYSRLSEDLFTQRREGAKKE